MQKLTYQFGRGDIHTIAKEAISFARKHQARDGKSIEVCFVFNELEVTAYSSSEPIDIVEKYLLQSTIRRLKSGYED